MSNCEENDENVLLAIAEIFDAIADGDEQALARCLESSTIGTMLQFEATYGATPLAYLVEAADVSHLGLVRRLLRSGLCDCEATDSKGRTVLARLAHAHNAHPAFVESIIQLVIEGADDATACFRMLKHNSTELFRTFLALRPMDEARLFQSLTSALTQLSVKRLLIAPELQVFALWKLADYGYRQLSGDWTGNDTDEWRHHIEVVIDCWSAIDRQYDTRKYEDVDDRLLHRLHVIHNHLYFLQHKPFLAYLPMREIIFCVAIFLNIFNNENKFLVYRLMVNKCQVMEYVRMITRQLALVQASLRTVEQEIITIVEEVKSLGAQQKQNLIMQLMEKIHQSDIKNKTHVVKQFEEKVQAIDATNGHSDALIKELMKRVKQIDKRWTEKKMQELKAIHSAARDHLIAQITHRLEHAAHPQNVADRLIVLSKQADCAGTIAAVIVASERFDLEHLMRGKDRRTGRRLAKCYTQMKQFYSLHKVIVAFSRIAEAAPANTAVFLNSLRRAVMVLGEAMKNTKSTPNMPNGRVEEAMNRMLTEQFSAMNIFHRDRYARGYSLTRLRVTDELERTVFREIPEHKAVIGAVLHLLYILALANIRRSFYGTLLRCGTLETLRALLMYVGEKDTILPLQHESVQIVQEYFTYVEALFAELRENEVSQTAQFAHIDGQLKLQCSMFEELQAMLDIEKSFDFQSLRKSCFSCNDLATVRRMFHWKMESYHPNRLLETICTKWDASIAKLSYVQELDWRLKWIDPTTISCKLGMLQVALSSADEDYCLSRTRELVESIGVADSVDEQALHMLRDMLRPYYENIFLLPSKWKVLETFCAHRQLLWDKSLARKLRLRDQEHLQALFDNRRTMLRAILEQYGVATADVLYVAVVILTDNILASLEYLQLELCEMLTAVGYFGDSFHYMKHRIPMIQGKNYRNLLAHDSLSYNLLTASGDSKLVINAFVFAQTDVRLFERQSNETVHLNFPTLQDTYRWVEEQQQLLAALKKDDLAQVHAAMRSGAEIKSRFCCSPYIRNIAPTFLPLTDMAHWYCRVDSSVVLLLGLYFAGYADAYQLPDIRLKRALARRNFEEASEIVDDGELIRGEFCAWPDLMSHLCVELLSTMTLPERQHLFNNLLDHGNEQCLREIDRLVVGTDEGHLTKAILRGLRSTVELMLHKTYPADPKALELVIILHWNAMLADIMKKTKVDGEVYMALLKTAIKMKNDTAFMYLLAQERCPPEVLHECFILAAFHGVYTMLKYMQDSHRILDSLVLSTALHRAVLNKHGKCVQLLLDSNAAVDVVMSDYLNEEKNVLLLLVMHGQVRVIRRIASLNRSIYGTLIEHPFAVAVRYDTASSRMIRALRLLGFDWLDSSTTLHEAILEGYAQPAWNTLWSEIDSRLSQRVTLASEHCTLAMNVLERWKMIAFVEEPNLGTTSLCCAAETGDSDVLRMLLKRCRSMRRLDDIGTLGNIVFQMSTSIVQFCTAHDQWDITRCCEYMITALSSTSNELWWQTFEIDAGVTISVHILTATTILQPFDVTLRISNTASLLSNLHFFASSSLFSEYPAVYATYTKESCTEYFMRIESSYCAFDIFPSDSYIDISKTLNARTTDGETVLRKAVEYGCDIETMQLLMENGANPLIADDNGEAPIHLALRLQTEPIALYFIDECLKCDLRNGSGVSLLELDNGCGSNRLIHTAAANGHASAIVRLLEHNIDVTVQNVEGATPALIVAIVPRYNSVSLMKLLLDYDSKPVNMVDREGRSLLYWVAHSDSIEMLDLIVTYNPDFAAYPNREALYEAVTLHHVVWAKRFLHHVISKGDRGVTEMKDEGYDIVIQSLHCTNFELSKALLEYELEHSLEEVTASDRPRIEAVVKASTSKIPHVPMDLLLHLKGLSETENFLAFLSNLLNELPQ